MLDLRLSQGRVDDLARYIGVAQTATARAAAINHRPLAFSRRQPLDPPPIHIARLIADTADLVRRTVGPSTRVESVHPDGLRRSDEGRVGKGRVSTGTIRGVPS